MNPYFQTSRQISWALFCVTLMLASLVSLSMGFVSVFLWIIQRFLGGGSPWLLGPSLKLAVAVILPALLLARFYFVVAAKRPSPRYTQMGWILSACYHAAMTWLFLFVMPGTVQTSMSFGLKMPLAFLSAAACGASIYLLVRYPRSSAVQDFPT